MSTLVHTPAGLLRGASTGAVTTFLGIPYGSAERFAAPRPVTRWNGVREALRPGPASPQPAPRLARVVGPASDLRQGEDCLSLNVWTPGGSGLPVLVWLHGGGFTSGSGADAWYDGALLAERGRMVVVTVNYRLGALGYLYLAPEFAPANLGLLDQIAALDWVGENIAAFGGDPDRVTLAGQSAGALSAVALLHHPAGRGLFRQVILQSTPAGVRPYSTGEAAGIGEIFLDTLGLRPDDAEPLRTLPLPDLLAAQAETARRTARPQAVTPPFQLVASGGVPADLTAGVPQDVPMLIGTTRDEGWAFFPGTSGELTERLFRDGSLHIAEQARQAHVYQFDWCPPDSPFGACHCIELPFVFGGLNAWRASPMLAGAEPADLRRLVAQVQPAWASFVHTGSPGWAPFPCLEHITLI
ncbi:carboxylesterase/lipase family protein [Nonomuraea sp. NEAU-A123]|uniref:carboxylesterase/lipase family protein n=1 Tax=Nonomuraea sp. NEAU-A123 TaxID=2839649 RepID=UPI001BE4485C|nr:carboxylesterase family protein [Nonomuraea sp. NEAU-A123]MBT2225177.1 carboxylesterase family protein [Nonomuraea sp. NEAU-A123]